MFSIISLIRFLIQFCLFLLFLILLIYYYDYYYHFSETLTLIFFHMKLGFHLAIFTLLLSWNNYCFTYRFSITFLCLIFSFFILFISFQNHHFINMWRRFLCLLPRRKSSKKYKKINSCSIISKNSPSPPPAPSPPPPPTINSDILSCDPMCLCSGGINSNSIHNQPNLNPNQLIQNQNHEGNRVSSSSSSCHHDYQIISETKSRKRSSSSIDGDDDDVAGFDPLMSFKDVVSDGEKRTLFISKLCLCGTIIVDFKEQNNTKNSYQKDLKKLILLELNDFISSLSSATTRINYYYSEPEILAVCKMCSSNLFRPLPSSSSPGGGVFVRNDQIISYCLGDHMVVDDHNDYFREQRYDPAWSHLKLVYDLLLYFITSSSLDARIAKKYIDYTFILGLFNLFDSEDPRERECLKIILHRIYGKFVVHRPFIRKNISYIFHEYALGIEKHNGITELLEIIGSVIAGFALPLKAEFKVLLIRVLIPLHKPRTLGMYIQQLTNCMMQYISKEPKLGSRIISGMLKFWPKTNTRKEVMFLNELEDILQAIQMAEFQKVMIPLFQRLRCCISSYSSQVAERAMMLWNNDQFVNLVEVNRHVILPIIFPALDHNTKCHWNQVTLNLTYDVRNIFLQMDIPLFNACQKQKQEHQLKNQILQSLETTTNNNNIKTEEQEEEQQQQKQHIENSSLIKEQQVLLLTSLQNSSVLC